MSLDAKRFLAFLFILFSFLWALFKEIVQMVMWCSKQIKKIVAAHQNSKK